MKKYNDYFVYAKKGNEEKKNKIFGEAKDELFIKTTTSHLTPQKREYLLDVYDKHMVSKINALIDNVEDVAMFNLLMDNLLNRSVSMCLNIETQEDIIVFSKQVLKNYESLTIEQKESIKVGESDLFVSIQESGDVIPYMLTNPEYTSDMIYIMLIKINNMISTAMLESMKGNRFVDFAISK